MKTPAIQRTQRPPARHLPPRPLVVFDMALRQAGDSRYYPAVSGAAMTMSSVLHERKIADFAFMRLPFCQGGEIELDRKRPLIFALTVYDDLWLETKKELALIKEKYPTARIILGGPGVTSWSGSLRELHEHFPQADALVRGDGQPVIESLVMALAKRQIDFTKASKLHGVYVSEQGLAWRSEHPNRQDTIHFNGNPPLVHPFPDLIMDIRERRSLSFNTSIGCKHRCVFCSTIKRPPVYWRVGRIIQELLRIREMVEEGSLPLEARVITFVDDDFFLDRDRARHFFQTLKGHPLLSDYFRFLFQSSVSSLLQQGQPDIELLDLVAPNNHFICLGTDGFHPKALSFFRKGNYTLDQALDLIKAIKAREIKQVHYVILTYPQITRQELLETLNILEETIVQDYNPAFHYDIAYFLSVIENSPLWQLFQTQHPDNKVNHDGNKVLAFNYPLDDTDLVRDLDTILKLPFPSKQDLEHALPSLDAIKKVQILQCIIYFTEIGRWPTSFDEIINCGDTIIQWMGIRFLRDQIERPGQPQSWLEWFQTPTRHIEK
ncbi:hypothetical protein A2311_04050 [candidate division WOR-1 bacterium RIFOXYB2_FULL_48_7]|uniref:Elp3/MiaA/NifB-like radical SAM core domain-containing protein n=1 Tax=candidate division WOR-1 bacterium RIFOXYB2_FULL_48_7 TaxID=1802583 RepID=A0A1F4TXC6_UNCSA|nr:MAG: hypothetical protein A2311_04050 [candidate division WOR-1 bacterium RIFOXYB2_FULL_48_7]